MAETPRSPEQFDYDEVSRTRANTIRRTYGVLGWTQPLGTAVGTAAGIAGRAVYDTGAAFYNALKS